MSIGYVIFGVILIPLFGAMVIGTVSKPRNFKVSAQFTFVLILAVAAMVVVFAVLGWVLGYLIPS